ncbi:MAG: HYC_CC_PP family protein [Bacteroidia bacterium]
MKKLFTYSFSVWLSICVLLASVGVPVFAHTCNMNSDCKEVSVLPEQGCCSNDEPVEKPANGCVETEDCCKDELTIVKAELPAIKIVTHHYSIVPMAIVAMLPGKINLHFGQSYRHFKLPPQNAPPSLSGRDILTQIQVFRI